MALLSLFIILTLSLLSAAAQAPPPPSPPQQSLLNAADTLSNSGYNAMSLTLDIIAPTLPTPTLTVFSPPDSAFSASGQPSLFHLLLHFSPLSLSSSSLLSLPFSATVPSLSPSKHLTVTTNGGIVSLNNVKISQSPIFDDGFVIVYAIDDFFDFNFTLLGTENSTTRLGFQCVKLERVSTLEEASGVLKSRGYSIMASFLDLQLMGFLDRGDVMKWTVFAPLDGDLVRFSGDFLGYSSMFLRHLVPCKVGWVDLDGMVNGTQVSKNVDGFGLEITRNESDEMLKVNGVEITFPDMYENEQMVVHGIRGVLPLPEIAEEFGVDEKVEASTTAPDRGEF